MTVTCKEVCAWLERLAPPGLAVEGDRIGLQLGSPEQKVGRLFLALELTPRVVQEALAFEPDMIFVHHTPFYRPFPRLREDFGHDRVVLELIRRQVALYTAHTNLDRVRGGVSDALAELVGIRDSEILQPVISGGAEAGFGRVGRLSEPTRLGTFARALAKGLAAPGLRYCGDPASPVSTVACCGGSGAFLMTEAKSRGADVLVTGDVGHHDGAAAWELGLSLVDAGHFATENPVIPKVAAYLREKMPRLTLAVSAVSGDPFKQGL